MGARWGHLRPGSIYQPTSIITGLYSLLGQRGAGEFCPCGIYWKFRPLLKGSGVHSLGHSYCVACSVLFPWSFGLCASLCIISSVMSLMLQVLSSTMSHLLLSPASEIFISDIIVFNSRSSIWFSCSLFHSLPWQVHIFL